MKKKNLIIILILVLMLMLVGALLWQHYLDNNVDYQLKMLQSPNAETKIKAISFLSDKKIISIIPSLINNIDNQDRGNWGKDPKGGDFYFMCNNNRAGNIN